ncbi:MAG: FAD binding domain-containing protein [bacterium]|nr:FAD binding domain-containing protein [bacterium]MBK9304406.1 FAD binding domain-containing protein [bacterium]
MAVKAYLRPKSAAEALSLIEGDERAALIGGGAYLRLASRGYETAVDLCDAGLDQVRVEDGALRLGAMVTYRRLETDVVVRDCCGGLLGRCVQNIVGVQVRNIVTVGGTVAGRYAFANLTTALLALGADVVLERGGRKPLEHFLADKATARDVLVEVVVPTTAARCAWRDLTRVRTDFAVLNVAAVGDGGAVRVAVGARPGAARLARGAMQAAAAGDARGAGAAAAAELDFGDDLRASADYRRRVCAALVTRAVEEVLA